ncbi:uncharacterized protein LY89DRAFT_726866 [Mollisia scopiformis]|uniref:Zn(2)-C6 fungal-type domain-containing protein n=1 Tax=Mollisia scopiformis TaxID=149040 RepID=A0A194XUC2_MOLSC|nr:uncharacterized protein LY89DRAFT_726866 [Mollisia scopiformis]KUJ23808.1 hypothetical protein LY89DRAFT_726866 [Mollisia scopiformis]
MINTGTASKACIACRDRKRKCDRIKPSCSLCYRLGRVCHYEPRSRRNDTSVVLSSTPLQVPTVTLLSPPETPPLCLQPDVNKAITGRLLHAVGDISAIRVIAENYFGSVHRWFPILSEVSYYEQLTSTYTDPNAEYSLLSLSMALITLMPSEDESFSSLYMLVKSAIAIVEAANIHSLEVVQARLLVTLFEAGHGIEPAAFISMAATTRAAVAIGLNQKINDPCCHDENINSKIQAGLRVWWGLVMLDRSYTIERGEGSCATHQYESPQYLPRDGSVWDNKILSSAKPLNLSTPSSIRVGGFARQAQVSHVLHILMMHLHDSRTSVPDPDEADQIARTLTAFSMLLPEETPQPWPMYCGALGMCFSAMMTLHESRPRTSLSEEYLNCDQPESLRSSLERIHGLCTRFNARIEQVSVDAMSPFPPYGLIRAATLRHQLFKETGDYSHITAADSLTLMVKHFSKRWKRAGKNSN